MEPKDRTTAPTMGRPPLKRGERSATISARSTHEQKRQFFEIGGAIWLRDAITAAWKAMQSRQ
jgi:hypothetical protein